MIDVVCICFSKIGCKSRTKETKSMSTNVYKNKLALLAKKHIYADF